MSAPSTTPRIALSDNLSARTYRAVARIAYEMGIQPDDLNDCRYLCWLTELLKHVKDTPNNFPRGKYSTIKLLNDLTSEAAREVARIYYGNV